MVEEEKKDKVGSLGWLTESAILSKRHKAIESVGPSSILELKAQVYKTQEEASVEFHRSKKKITPHNVYSQKNSRVKARAHRIMPSYCGIGRGSDNSFLTRLASPTCALSSRK